MLGAEAVPLGAAEVAMWTERLGAAGCCEGGLLLGRPPEGPVLGRPEEGGQRAEEGLSAAAGTQPAGCVGRGDPGCAVGAGYEVVQKPGQPAQSEAAVWDEVRAAVVGAGRAPAGCGHGPQVPLEPVAG